MKRLDGFTSEGRGYYDDAGRYLVQDMSGWYLYSPARKIQRHTKTLADMLTYLTAEKGE